ncbi:MAG: hypothetical protein A3E84_02685 [Gammaproteobacteria bacterium RIFCSPHIGHO2_12_FULL_42_13]|nr:MAG: hypothetical protein A3E84_02685 [Gammaproteobacteria bacterium RIFCSPHIGHO2_12_FULL_42_13]
MVSADKDTYILIHGAWHASWCWRYVVPLLEAKGHRVIAPDLPGHGEYIMDFRRITLDTYVDYVTELVQAQSRRVVLVGHSLAGVIISQVAENIPECIKELIYIAAFIPETNKSLLQEASRSKSSGVSTEIMTDEAKNEVSIIPSPRVRELFYNCCRTEDVDFAFSHLQAQPYRPLADTIHISSERFGKVKKRYVECMQDMALEVDDQRRMYAKTNCTVASIHADHSPFFSAVDELVKVI